MSAEEKLIRTEVGEATLLRGPDGSALRVVTPHGRAQVPLSHEQGEQLARACEGAGPGEPVEVERKLLVASPPDLTEREGQRLRQGYLLVAPDASLRIREKGGGCKITVKRGTGLERTETELDVSKVQADLLWPLAGPSIVDKTRYLIPDGDGALELDRYHGRHDGLVTVEREFEDVEAALRWSPPAWAGADVTDDPRYTNARLALDGLPPQDAAGPRPG